MGIFIHLVISENIKKDEWLRVYEESLKLVKAFPFYEMAARNYYGEKLYCAVPTEEREWLDRMGWHTIGDYQTLRSAEDYFLPRDLGRDDYDGELTDALMGLAPAYCGFDWEDERCNQFYNLWGNKTQGEPYHMYLLAIACMLESRLGEKAAVYGDITMGQCLKAVELANQYLEEPIDIPVRCDAQRFYKRVRRLPLKTDEVLSFFISCFLGVVDASLGKFIRDHFTDEEIDSYWIDDFENINFGTIGFERYVHKYLTLGFSLTDLCRYIQYAGHKGEDDYEYFVRLIMKTSMHIKEKNCEDCLEIDPESEQPYSIYTLMAQFAFSGVRNQKVDRYMPLDEICQTLQACIGQLCDVDAIIQQYCEEQRKAAEENGDIDDSEIFNEIIKVQTERMQQAEETYDIASYDTLPYYEAGDSIQPNVKEGLIKSYQFYSGIIKEDKFITLMEASPQDRCQFLIQQNQSVCLREEDWRHIFSEIEKEKDAFERYYPMVRVKITSENVLNIVRAFVLNDALYKYCEEAQTTE